jgi:predicted dehydrogenase
MGIDVKQAKQALEIAKQVKPIQSVDVGFQCRNAPPIAAIAEKIKAGALGKIATISSYYYAPASKEKVFPGAGKDEYRLRNWLWDRALSGDILVEQNIHVIDLCNWIIGAHPIKATATGGRNAVTHAGDTWDNYQVIYTYPNGVHLSFSSTQWGNNGFFDVTERVFGEKGIAEAPYSGPVRIIGDNAWEWKPEGAPATAAPGTFAANGAFTDNLEFADREKDKAFIESIASGQFHNQAQAGVDSALSAMLGRMAGQLGQEVTWEEQLQHGEPYTMNIDMSQFG